MEINALTDDSAAWKQRYRTATYTCSGVARDQPARAVIATNKDGVGQIYAWDRETGAMSVKTDSPAGKGGGQISKSGEWIFFHKDLNGPGSEIGHYVKVKFDAASGPGDEVSLTPESKPYAASGLAESDDGSTMALCVAVDGGQTVYIVKGGVEGGAAPVEYHRVDELVQTRSFELSGDGRYLSQSSNEHTLAGWGTIAMDRALNIYDLSLPAGSPPVVTLWDGATTSAAGMFSPTSYGDELLLACTTSASGFDRTLLWEPLTGTRRQLPALDGIPGQLTPVCFADDGSKLLLRQLHRAEVSLHVLDVAAGTVDSLADQPKGVPGAAFFDSRSGELVVGFANESTAAMVCCRRRRRCRAAVCRPSQLPWAVSAAAGC